MKPRVLLVAAFTFGLVLAACGGDATGSATTIGPEEPGTTITPDTAADAGAATTSTSQAEAPSTTAGEGAGGSDRPAAPDFTLELGSGGTFTLSEEQKPVFMVFWAEW